MYICDSLLLIYVPAWYFERISSYNYYMPVFYATLAEDDGWASTDGDAHIKLQAAKEENSLLHEEMWRVKVCSS